jgi:hypothetical protein
VHIIHCSVLCLFHNKVFGLTSPYKVGRMMMNIRGLILEDPEHTLHLQTLQFDHDTVTDSDTHITY